MNNNKIKKLTFNTNKNFLCLRKYDVNIIIPEIIKFNLNRVVRIKAVIQIARSFLVTFLLNKKNIKHINWTIIGTKKGFWGVIIIVIIGAESIKSRNMSLL